LRYRGDNPRVYLTLTEHRSINVVRMLENGAFDLGLAMASPEMLSNPAVHFEPIGKRFFTLVTPTGHPLAGKRTLAIRDLAKYPLITFSRDNPFRRNVERAFEQAGLKSNIVIEIDTVETADHFVGLGMGIGIVLASRKTPLEPGIQYRSLSSMMGEMPLYLLWEKGTHLLPHIAEFVRLVDHAV
jgi:DNA-binding transcriptional LysR family regulator